jgi:hypothetical protein
VFLCELRDEHPAGDHTVVLGRVRAVHALRVGAGLDTVSLRRRGPRLEPCGRDGGSAPEPTARAGAVRGVAARSGPGRRGRGTRP